MVEASFVGECGRLGGIECHAGQVLSVWTCKSRVRGVLRRGGDGGGGGDAWCARTLCTHARNAAMIDEDTDTGGQGQIQSGMDRMV